MFRLTQLASWSYLIRVNTFKSEKIWHVSPHPALLISLTLLYVRCFHPVKYVNLKLIFSISSTFWRSKLTPHSLCLWPVANRRNFKVFRVNRVYWHTGASSWQVRSDCPTTRLLISDFLGWAFLRVLVKVTKYLKAFFNQESVVPVIFESTPWCLTNPTLRKFSTTLEKIIQSHFTHVYCVLSL